MPLVMKSVGCWHHLIKLNEDHSGHSGPIEMLHICESLDHESVLRTTPPGIGMLPYCREFLTASANAEDLANTRQDRGPCRAALIPVLSKLQVSALSCRVMGECVLNQNCEEQFLQKNCVQPDVFCTQNTHHDIRAWDAICSFIDGEHLREDI